MEHQGWGNLWAEPKPRLQAAGRGLQVSPKKPSAPQLAVLARGQGRGRCQSRGDPHAAAGTSEPHAGFTSIWGTLGLVQARGLVVPSSSVAPSGIWGLGVLVASLLPLLGWFGGMGCRSLVKISNKAQAG